MTLRQELKSEIAENMRGFNICHENKLKEGLLTYSRLLHKSIKLLDLTYGQKCEIIYNDDGYIDSIKIT